MGRAYLGSSSYSHSDKQNFVINSGAKNHMCSSMKLLSNIQSVPQYSVTLGDKSLKKGDKCGEVDIILDNQDQSCATGKWLRLTILLYLNALGINLLSTSALDEHDMHTTFKKENFI